MTDEQTTKMPDTDEQGNVHERMTFEDLKGEDLKGRATEAMQNLIASASGIYVDDHPEQSRPQQPDAPAPFLPADIDELTIDRPDYVQACITDVRSQWSHTNRAALDIVQDLKDPSRMFLYADADRAAYVKSIDHALVLRLKLSKAGIWTAPEIDSEHRAMWEQYIDELHCAHRLRTGLSS